MQQWVAVLLLIACARLVAAVEVTEEVCEQHCEKTAAVEPQRFLKLLRRGNAAVLMECNPVSKRPQSAASGGTFHPPNVQSLVAAAFDKYLLESAKKFSGPASASTLAVFQAAREFVLPSVTEVYVPFNPSLETNFCLLPKHSRKNKCMHQCRSLIGITSDTPMEAEKIQAFNNMPKTTSGVLETRRTVETPRKPAAVLPLTSAACPAHCSSLLGAALPAKRASQPAPGLRYLAIKPDQTSFLYCDGNKITVFGTPASKKEIASIDSSKSEAELERLSKVEDTRYGAVRQSLIEDFALSPETLSVVKTAEAVLEAQNIYEIWIPYSPGQVRFGCAGLNTIDDSKREAICLEQCGLLAQWEAADGEEAKSAVLKDKHINHLGQHNHATAEEDDDGGLQEEEVVGLENEEDDD
eukprot:gnl/Hemi2/12894_TR4403_c0_g5_i1.p1 gnl/Hemi2/12894_TR4403_c0_g5~~gnl/Hemi2/12894_TR4403_c0_g5_i1.p1  ORF type:complete len:431 (-),score=172.26 gnl/Hemi2/12894_TR4403_c0_g5_i1:94-1326(-)